MTRLSAWSDVLPGTLVTLRRGPLTGERVERTKAWTASGPYVSDSGVACIRVEVGGVVVSYPLDRVSLGWTEPPLPPAPVRIADALDPAPVDPWTAGERVVGVMFALLGIYVFGAVLALVFG